MKTEGGVIISSACGVCFCKDVTSLTKVIVFLGFPGIV